MTQFPSDGHEAGEGVAAGQHPGGADAARDVEGGSLTDAAEQQAGVDLGQHDLAAQFGQPGTGQPGTSQPGTGQPGTQPDLARQLAERTEDLQRVQAEYVNYKKRVDRDRALARQGGVEAVVGDLLPVLDAIELADQHGELTGGFKGVADELGKVAAKHGLAAYGAPGDVFDPQLHDALMQVPGQPGTTEPVVAQVLQTGYRVGDRIVRHARVAVAEPQ